MTQHDDLFYVRNMLDYARMAADKTSAWGIERYRSDDTLQLALTHVIQIIGEAAAKVTPAFCAAHPEVPWPLIVGTRHRVVHDYLHVDIDVLWNTAVSSIPALIPKLEAILSEPNP